DAQAGPRPVLIRAARIASHTRAGVSGMSRSCTPSGASASRTALTKAAGAPIVPDSPQPFAPSGLWVQGWLSSTGDRVEEPADFARLAGGGRLVEDQHARAAAHRPGHGDELTLGVRERIGARARVDAETETGEASRPPACSCSARRSTTARPSRRREGR